VAGDVITTAVAATPAAAIPAATKHIAGKPNSSPGHGRSPTSFSFKQRLSSSTSWSLKGRKHSHQSPRQRGSRSAHGAGLTSVSSHSSLFRFRRPSSISTASSPSSGHPSAASTSPSARPVCLVAPFFSAETPPPTSGVKRLVTPPALVSRKLSATAVAKSAVAAAGDSPLFPMGLTPPVAVVTPVGSGLHGYAGETPDLCPEDFAAASHPLPEGLVTPPATPLHGFFHFSTTSRPPPLATTTTATFLGRNGSKSTPDGDGPPPPIPHAAPNLEANQTARAKVGRKSVNASCPNDLVAHQNQASRAHEKKAMVISDRRMQDAHTLQADGSSNQIKKVEEISHEKGKKYQFAPEAPLLHQHQALTEGKNGTLEELKPLRDQNNEDQRAKDGDAPNVFVLSAPVRGHPGISVENAAHPPLSNARAPEWLPSFPVTSFLTLASDQKMSAICSSPQILSHQPPPPPEVGSACPPSATPHPSDDHDSLHVTATTRRTGGNNLHLIVDRYARMSRANWGVALAKNHSIPQHNLLESFQNVSISTSSSRSPRPVSFASAVSSTPTRFGDLPVRSDEDAFAPYTFLAVLGKGNFGKVILSRDRRRHDNRLCAIKVLKKHDMFKKREVVHTMTEASVLKTLRHPFLVQCYSAFQTATRLCLVLEFVVGGELYYHLFKERRFSEERTKFYVSEIVLAVGFLHANDFIYRDLKLENLLLDAAGHIKIADFGLCKDLKAWKNEQLFGGGSVDVSGQDASTSNCSTTRRRTPTKRDMTFCGTPEYLAPEMLHAPGSFNLISRGANGCAGASCGLLIYGKGVDWWALGIIIFEMLLGKLPFRTKTGDYDHLFHSICHRDISFPDSLNGDVRILLEGLLQKNPLQRLGHSNGNGRDYLDICESSWFSDVDWDAVYQKKIPSPFIPEIHDAEDTRHFSREFLDMPTELTPTSSFALGYHGNNNNHHYHHRYWTGGGGGGGGKLGDDLFRGFSFTRNESL